MRVPVNNKLAVIEYWNDKSIFGSSGYPMLFSPDTDIMWVKLQDVIRLGVQKMYRLPGLVHFIINFAMLFSVDVSNINKDQ